MSLTLSIMAFSLLPRVFHSFVVTAVLSAVFFGCRSSAKPLITVAKATNPERPMEASRHVTRYQSAPLPSIAFGASAWKKYFGVNVDEEPALPNNINQILNSKAPFLLHEEQTHPCVVENHLLTLIPGTVNGEAFTLDKLGALVLNNHNGHFSAFQKNKNENMGEQSHGYRYYDNFIEEKFRQTPLAGAPYWVLLPKRVLRLEDDKYRCSFNGEGRLIVAFYNGDYELHSDYKLPHVLEVAASLLAHYAQSHGRRWYSSSFFQKGLQTSINCSDLNESGDLLSIDFEESGLSLFKTYSNANTFGISCSRKL